MMNTTGRIPAMALGALCLVAAGCGEKTVATPSGLKYADLVAGKGDPAKSGDFVEVHAVGWLQSDETRFENTYAKAPVLFRLGTGEVIKGWDEGIAGMKPGGKRKLLVPAALAYGSQGRGLLLPPNSDLVFEVELLRVVAGFAAEDVAEGEGPVAKWQDRVELSYHGALRVGGKTFDRNLSPEILPWVFQIGDRNPQMAPIPRGLECGIVGMKLGGRRKIAIPAELAYGARGRPPHIPPEADLAFEVELTSIVAEPPPVEGAAP
jgi:peptidylprolyl isomerase